MREERCRSCKGLRVKWSQGDAFKEVHVCCRCLGTGLEAEGVHAKETRKPLEAKPAMNEGTSDE